LRQEKTVGEDASQVRCRCVRFLVVGRVDFGVVDNDEKAQVVEEAKEG